MAENKDIRILQDKARVLEDRVEALERILSPIPSVEYRRIFERVMNDVLPDKLFDVKWRTIYDFNSLFESRDGWNSTAVQGSGSATIGSDFVRLLTSNGSGDANVLFKDPDIQNIITFSQSSRFRTSIEVGNVFSQTLYITIGSIYDGGQGYGFKIVNAVLSGVTDDGSSENLVTLQTLVANKEYMLEARYEPGKGVTFYVDDVNASPATPLREVGSSTVNLPSSVITPNDSLAYFYVRTDTTANKDLKFTFFDYSQLKAIKS